MEESRIGVPISVMQKITKPVRQDHRTLKIFSCQETIAHFPQSIAKIKRRKALKNQDIRKVLHLSCLKSHFSCSSKEKDLQFLKL